MTSIHHRGDSLDVPAPPPGLGIPETRFNPPWPGREAVLWAYFIAEAVWHRRRAIGRALLDLLVCLALLAAFVVALLAWGLA
jgi:hypothetical protein